MSADIQLGRDDGLFAECLVNADVYVFAVVTARDHESYDPLDSTQWAFWVLPRSTEEATGQRSLTLVRVEGQHEEQVNQ